MFISASVVLNLPKREFSQSFFSRGMDLSFGKLQLTRPIARSTLKNRFQAPLRLSSNNISIIVRVHLEAFIVRNISDANTSEVNLNHASILFRSRAACKTCFYIFAKSAEK